MELSAQERRLGEINAALSEKRADAKASARLVKNLEAEKTDLLEIVLGKKEAEIKAIKADLGITTGQPEDASAEAPASGNKKVRFSRVRRILNHKVI